MPYLLGYLVQINLIRKEDKISCLYFGNVT